MFLTYHYLITNFTSNHPSLTHTATRTATLLHFIPSIPLSHFHLVLSPQTQNNVFPSLHSILPLPSLLHLLPFRAHLLSHALINCRQANTNTYVYTLPRDFRQKHPVMLLVLHSPAHLWLSSIICRYQRTLFFWICPRSNTYHDRSFIPSKARQRNLRNHFRITLLSVPSLLQQLRNLCRRPETKKELLYTILRSFYKYYSTKMTQSGRCKTS